jgi:rfaE bifunctional protein kinase chain/domain
MKQRLSRLIDRLNQVRVLIVGDIAIDEMVYGATSRLSREAPVLILSHHHTDILLGAAGNAAHNVARLQAARTAVIGVCGTDYHAGLLTDALTAAGVDCVGLVATPDRPTTTKTRLSGIANQSVTQQIVRIDRESRQPIPPHVEDELCAHLEALAPSFDAVLLSDYGLGVVTPKIIETCRRLGLLWTVDSQQDLRQFASACLVTPNQPEAEKNLGYPLNDEDTLLRGGRQLLDTTGVQNVLITRGGDGMSLFEATGETTHIPVFNRSEVFDVTGAGDTVISTMTLALASGATPVEAAILGNLAASIVVKRFGAATTTPTELQEALEALEDQLLPQWVNEAL